MKRVYFNGPQYKRFKSISYLMVFGIIFYEWKVVDDFKIEDIYIYFTTLLLLINWVINLKNTSLWNIIISSWVNITLLATAVFNFWAFTIAHFGFMYTTGQIPLGWYLALIANFLVIVISVIDLYSTPSIRSTKNR